MNEDEARRRMVQRQLAPRGIRDQAVLDAMQSVPRHLFVGSREKSSAYEDYPLQIGGGQTISQPYIVALMTQAAKLKKGSKVLEIGTGSGYQAAVLSELGCRVYTVERLPELADLAKQALQAAGYLDVQSKLDDGTLGWPEHAPFDAILVTAAAPALPPSLLEQLAEGGHLVIPVGDRIAQDLLSVTRDADGSIHKELVERVRFVPLIGQEGWENG